MYSRPPGVQKILQVSLQGEPKEISSGAYRMALAARGVMKGVSTSIRRLKNCARRPSRADAAERMLVLCSCLTWAEDPDCVEALSSNIPPRAILV